MAKGQTYSPYKESNTMTFLTVIANGLIMFVSAAYGGRALDTFITRTCGVEEYLCAGDTIMAHKGLKLDPHLEVQGISMNVPVFNKGVIARLVCDAGVTEFISHRKTPGVRGRSDQDKADCVRAYLC